MEGLLALILLTVVIYAVVRVIRHVKKEKYFSSDDFYVHVI